MIWTISYVSSYYDVISCYMLWFLGLLCQGSRGCYEGAWPFATRFTARVFPASVTECDHMKLPESIGIPSTMMPKAILQGFLNKHEAKLPGSPKVNSKVRADFSNLFTVYISLDLSTVYLSLFVYVCVYVLFGSPSTCEVNVFFWVCPSIQISMSPDSSCGM